MKNILGTITLLLAFSLLHGCGGGGGGSGTPPVVPPPVDAIIRTGIAVGPIDTFGSVVVNGVRYDTATATFTSDGAAASESDLNVGDVVTVMGTIEDDGLTGTAETVATDDTVKGPIESIDLALSQIVVLGQTVLIRPETSFDDTLSPASIDGLSVSMIVEVSGQIDANGNVLATRIEPKPAGTQFEVHGTVSGHNATTFVFSLNNLVVDYSGATLNDFPGNAIADGDFVEAKGVSLGAAGELIATIVDLEDNGLNGAADTHVEIEGFITRFVSATDFDVTGNPVTTNGSTTFVGGVAADLGLNIKVEVEGALDAGGLLVAEKVDIRRSKAVRGVAVADSVDAAAGSVVMLGITFTTDELTRFEDKSSADIRPLTIGDISAGDYLEIRGAEFPAGSGQILATIFEREDLDTRTELQGFVETVADPSLTILGVTIDTNGSTIFRDIDDNVISATDFFSQVAANSLVKASGSETGDTSILAQEVEFELEL